MVDLGASQHGQKKPWVGLACAEHQRRESPGVLNNNQILYCTTNLPLGDAPLSIPL